jgi:hypothetical protein
MQTELSVLLLITASVMITCVVISYGVGIVQTTLNTKELPELDRIEALQRSLMNQTDALQNQTGLLETNQTSP